MFSLMMHLRIDYASLRSMPVAYRNWFVRRLSLASEAAAEKDQYGLDSDTPLSALNS